MIADAAVSLVASTIVVLGCYPLGLILARLFVD